MPRSNPRRMSPSVTIPARRFVASSTNAIWMLPFSMAAIASLNVASVPTMALRQDFMVADLAAVAYELLPLRENTAISRLPVVTSIPAGEPESGLEQRYSRLGLLDRSFEVSAKPAAARCVGNDGLPQGAVGLHRCPARKPDECIA